MAIRNVNSLGRKERKGEKEASTPQFQSLNPDMSRLPTPVTYFFISTGLATQCTI